MKIAKRRYNSKGDRLVIPNPLLKRYIARLQKSKTSNGIFMEGFYKTKDEFLKAIKERYDKDYIEIKTIQIYHHLAQQEL